jgi:drug/metabolite transporter (DMT)-like permease
MVGIFFIFIACLFWGVDTLIRYPLVVKGIHPVTIVFFEHLILTFIFSWRLFSSIKKIGELKLIHIFSFLVVGGLGSAIATVAFTESFLYLNPSLVILLQKFQPIIAIILAAIFLREKIQGGFLFWTFICLVGGVLVSYPDVERLYELLRHNFPLVTSDVALKGYGLVGVSVIGWAGATVFGKKLSLMGYETFDILSGRFLVGLITLIPFVRWSPEILLSEGSDYVRIIVMVMLSGLLAMGLYYQGLKRLSAKTSAIAEMFFPLSAIVVNWYVLDKQLLTLQLVGAGILIFGSLIIQLKKY